MGTWFVASSGIRKMGMPDSKTDLAATGSAKRFHSVLVLPKLVTFPGTRTEWNDPVFSSAELMSLIQVGSERTLTNLPRKAENGACFPAAKGTMLRKMNAMPNHFSVFCIE